MYLILEFLHELRREKMRMFLTLLAICWGSANVVLMLSVGEGLRRQFGQSMSSMGEGIVLVWSGRTTKPYAGFGTGRWIGLREEDIPIIKRELPEIDLISAEYHRSGVILRCGRKRISVSIRGVYPCYGSMRKMNPEQGGRFLNELDEKRNRRVIFIGNNIRDQLFSPGEKVIGTRVFLNDIPFTVVGVMKKKYQMATYYEADQNTTIIPASTFRIMFGNRYLSNLIYRPRTPQEKDRAEAGFYRVMAARHRFDPRDKEVYQLWDTIEFQSTFDNLTLGIQIFMGFIGLLTLLIAGVGLANIMYVVIKERTREIGIKMAVGAKSRIIIGQFVLESILTVAIGGILGIGLALGMVKVIRILPIEHEVMNILGKPVFSNLLALLTVTILGFIGLMSGIFPARRASSIDPVEALRYE